MTCNIAPDRVRGKWIKDEDDDWSMYGEYGELPKKIQQWAGMSTGYGSIHTNDTHLNLADLNDCGHSFDEIADIIEENWEEW